MGSRVLARSRARMVSRGLGVFSSSGSRCTGCGATSGEFERQGDRQAAQHLREHAERRRHRPVRPRDVLNAEQLAFQQHASEVRPPYSLRLVPVDRGHAVGQRAAARSRTRARSPTSARSARHLRRFGRDHQRPGPARRSRRPTPRSSSPAKTAAVPDTPDRYYESLSTYGKTFARVVPNAPDRGEGAGPGDAVARRQTAVRRRVTERPMAAALALAVQAGRWRPR